ncbi:MAG: S-adenosylmethionine decarboxylase related protein [Clostridia bacterium]
MKLSSLSISLLGSSGGVAHAILTLLSNAKEDASNPIHAVMQNCQLHLIDQNQHGMETIQELYPLLQDQISLYTFDLRETNLLHQHLIQTGTKLVIDVSWADTIEILEVCDELGIPYVNTALETTEVDECEDFEGVTLLERWRVFQENRGRFTNTRAIVGSGMNPGVVQWMALELMKQSPEETPLACYIVEQDTSFFADPSVVEKKTLYCTWSPECFLDEAILSFPLFMKQKTPLMIYDDVYEREYKVTLGSKQFTGCLMPHEEVLSLGSLYEMETGFIYRVSDYTTDLIRENLDNIHDLWDWKHVVLDPSEQELVGEDLVGVLLVYKDRERYMYNVQKNAEIAAAHGINATYYQVASGLFGAICTVLLEQVPPGVHLVDELLLATNSNYGAYVTHYLKEYVTGENAKMDGLLLDRQTTLSIKRRPVLF